MREKPRIVVVLGSTASGKSDLAVRLAIRLSSGQAKKLYGINGAEIISADSRQVYRGMDIGTGKVPHDGCQVSGVRCQEKDGYFYRGVRHHLLDVASPKQKFTVTRYQGLASKAIRGILRRGKLPIICGGTGLYIDALLYGWQLPEVKPNWRLRKELEKKPTNELFIQLKKLDPKRAKDIDRHNRRRLVRALEIVIQTGRSSYSSVLKNNRISKYDVLKIGIKLPDGELKKRIKSRLVARVKHGMVREVGRLHAQGLSWSRLDSFGLEYRWISKFLRGEINKSEMIEKLNTEIWQYAKRQMTWFKRDKNILCLWVKNFREAERLVSVFLKS